MIRRCSDSRVAFRDRPDGLDHGAGHVHPPRAGSAKPYSRRVAQLPYRATRNPARREVELGVQTGVDQVPDLGRSDVTEGLRKAVVKRARLHLVLLRADRLEHVGREQRTDLRTPLESETPGESGEESCAETVANASRIGQPALRHRRTVIGGSPTRSMIAPRGPSVVTLTPTRASTSASDQPVLVSVIDFSYSLREQEGGALDEPADFGSVHPRQLLRGIGHKAVPTATALVGVPQHRLWIVRADDNEVEATDALCDGAAAR